MVVLSEGRHSYIQKYEGNASMLSRVIFYLQSVNFLFLFSIVHKISNIYAILYTLLDILYNILDI